MEIILNISNCETQKSVPLAPFLENTLLLSLCISSCLHLCHISLSSSFCCLFLTVCLEENNITPCYWMNFLHVSVHAYAQMPAGKRWLGMWLCVLVTNSIHAQLFSMSMWTCSCVRVYEYVLVHMCACGGVWLIGAAPHPQSTFRFLSHHTDLSYCPATSRYGVQQLTRH